MASGLLRVAASAEAERRAGIGSAFRWAIDAWPPLSFGRLFCGGLLRHFADGSLTTCLPVARLRLTRLVKVGLAPGVEEGARGPDLAVRSPSRWLFGIEDGW